MIFFLYEQGFHKNVIKRFEDSKNPNIQTLVEFLKILPDQKYSHLITQGNTYILPRTFCIKPELFDYNNLLSCVTNKENISNVKKNKTYLEQNFILESNCDAKRNLVLKTKEKIDKVVLCIFDTEISEYTPELVDDYYTVRIFETIPLSALSLCKVELKVYSQGVLHPTGNYELESEDIYFIKSDICREMCLSNGYINSKSGKKIYITCGALARDKNKLYQELIYPVEYHNQKENYTISENIENFNEITYFEKDRLDYNKFTVPDTFKDYYIEESIKDYKLRMKSIIECLSN